MSWETLISCTYNLIFFFRKLSHIREIREPWISSGKPPLTNVRVFASHCFGLKWDRKKNICSNTNLLKPNGAVCISFLLLYLVNLSYQSDTNSTEATKSTEGRLGTKLTDSPRSDRSRASGSPDGESPKGFEQERWVVCDVTVHWYYAQQFVKLPLAKKNMLAPIYTCGREETMSELSLSFTRTTQANTQRTLS